MKYGGYEGLYEYDKICSFTWNIPVKYVAKYISQKRHQSNNALMKYEINIQNFWTFWKLAILHHWQDNEGEEQNILTVWRQNGLTEAHRRLSPQTLISSRRSIDRLISKSAKLSQVQNWWRKPAMVYITQWEEFAVSSERLFLAAPLRVRSKIESRSKLASGVYHSLWRYSANRNSTKDAIQLQVPSSEGRVHCQSYRWSNGTFSLRFQVLWMIFQRSWHVKHLISNWLLTFRGLCYFFVPIVSAIQE